MRTAPSLARFVSAALLALLLGLRLLGATGYMPGFEHGVATIVVCPDADGDAPLAIDAAAHRHDHSKHKHGGLCPYASASSVGALGAGLHTLLPFLIFAAALLLGRKRRFLEQRRLRDRPQSRAPPLPA
jgi:hypothetical protein